MEWKNNETLEKKTSPILKKIPKWLKVINSSVRLPPKLSWNQVVSNFVV